MHFVNNYAIIIVQISLCIITYILNGGYNLFILLYHPQLFIADDICSILMCIGLTGYYVIHTVTLCLIDLLK